MAVAQLKGELDRTGDEFLRPAHGGQRLEARGEPCRYRG